MSMPGSGSRWTPCARRTCWKTSGKTAELPGRYGMNAECWRGKTVFLTGHTGFKGGWLALWLYQLGARVHGYALAPDTTPNLFTEAKVADVLAGHTIADIRDARALEAAMAVA